MVNKRGATELLMYIEIFIAVMAILLMFNVAKNNLSAASVSEKFLTKDAALMIDAMHSLNGDAVVYYQTLNYSEPSTLFALSGTLRLGPENDATGFSSIRQPYRESEFISIGENKVNLDTEKKNTIIFDKKESVVSMKKGESSEQES